MHYFDFISTKDDDHNIARHPFIDACDGNILFRLLEQLGFENRARVLDVGAGTGQVSRLLRGLPTLDVEALDRDTHSRDFFLAHPELHDVRFHLRDFLTDGLLGDFEAIVCRGVYHHVPKRDRPRFLETMTRHARVVVISDEGLREYATPQERSERLAGWYGFVIGEAKRRGLERLAEMEASFLAHERLDTADDGLDFKESPSHLIEDASIVGLRPAYVDRLGPWQTVGGGFYSATFIRGATSAVGAAG